MFRIELYQDEGVTGNLELTIFFNQKTVAKDGKGGFLVHSKKGGQGYGYEDWNSFYARLDKATQENTQK